MSPPFTFTLKKVYNNPAPVSIHTSTHCISLALCKCACCLPARLSCVVCVSQWCGSLSRVQPRGKSDMLPRLGGSLAWVKFFFCVLPRTLTGTILLVYSAAFPRRAAIDKQSLCPRLPSAALFYFYKSNKIHLSPSVTLRELVSTLNLCTGSRRAVHVRR